jgi:ribosomal protein S18 acetylase RimI-like enzyme
MLYRPYQPADFAAIYAVEEICFEPPLRFSRAYMRSLVLSPDSATWVAEESGGAEGSGDAEASRRLTGFAIVEWAGEPQTGPCAAYIETVEVLPGFRGRGIATELLCRIEESARVAGAGSIWLHVDAENSAAIRLYERQGYARQGREEHYYARRRAALVYAKPLGSKSLGER